MTKNLSPNQLYLISALIIAGVCIIPVAILNSDWRVIVCIFLLFFLFCYFFVKQIFDRFIYRKIKLIYKFINNNKTRKKEEMYNRYILPQKTMAEVSSDVEKWAQKSQAEIESLKIMETYRRDFMQNLSHEIKTPVFAIQGYVDMLLDGVLEDEDESRRLLEKVSKNVDRMTHLLKDVDEIARLETGELAMNREKFIIQDLILEVFDSLSIQTVQRNITTAIKKGCELPIAVFADKEKIRQVVINIVSNAAKYGKDGGHILASIYKIDGDKILLEISDDGIGIGEEHLPRVFERFYRTDKSRNRKVGGTGLGLAICKHIIEAHEETIHIRSKIGVGTTIGFTLAAHG
ncbi:MAG: two-component sensor histidine kinase [Pseudopedobacter saltans]|uniref:histidine kinase n=1 Tax=Pseudopedobacter saltans TaxID=151895 RepID=A0A2W5F2Q1_9SPHI|nr:MAG: two-component sensor histidine kinase [Pseudopedobacter saltans]